MEQSTAYNFEGCRRSVLDEALEAYCYRHTSRESELLLQLIEDSHAHMEYSKKISGRIVGRLLKLLVALSKPKCLLEIGTFTGYSVLSMAEAIDRGAHIFSLESNPKAVSFTRQYIDKTPYKDQITLIHGSAIDTLLQIEAPIDFVFIDADKRNYQNYFNMVFPKVRTGGLIVLDNVLWSGSVLQPQQDSDWSVVRVNKQILEEPKVENVLLGVRDGVNIVRKLAD